MRNKIVSIFLSLAFFLACSPSPIYAYEEVIQENTSYIQIGDYDVSTLNDGTICIVKYEGENTDVIIPSHIDGKEVTVIGKGAFFDQTRVETITIPDTVTTIQNGAFVNCVSLTSFEMPDTVTSIGEYIFGRDRALETVKLSNSLTEIPADTFYYCSTLNTVTIPDGVTTIGNGAFAYCTELNTVEFPDSIQSVGEAIFSCAMVHELVLPFSTLTKNVLQNAIIFDCSFTDNLESIEDDAFSYASIYTLNLPKSVSNIEPLAFRHLQNGDITVDKDNSNYCSKDGSLYSKDMSELIKFKNMNLDENVHTYSLPDSVKSIWDYAFFRVNINQYNQDTNYMTLTLPDSMDSIGEHAFDFSCITIKKMPDGLKSIPDFCFFMSQMKSVELQEGVESIGENAFADNSDLESITIPSTVSFIDPSAFAGCFNLKDVKLSKDNKNFIMKDGCLYDPTGETLLMYLQSEDTMPGDTFVIPEGTKAIGDEAFYYSALGGVEIPSSVTTIGEKAFYGNVMMDTIEIPSSVTTLKDKALGYSSDFYTNFETKAENFRIIADRESAAAKYALENKIGIYTEVVEEDDEIIEMNTGDTYLLDQTGVIPGTVQYTSTDDSIVTVDEMGNVTAITQGDTSIVRTSGTFNQMFDIHVEGDPIKIEASVGDFDPSIYTVYEDDFDDYLDDFIAFNQDVSYDPLDNECIICYSGNEYVALLAARGDPIRVKQIEDMAEWKYPDFFNMIGDGLYEELSKFSASQNVVLYRGIKDATEITKTGQSVEDMKNSIGSIFTPRTNVSTTLNHNVAEAFAYGTNEGAILEIYAPKEMLNGAYIDGISTYKGEAEYLMNEGAKFLVLDAGVREDDTFGLERYFKLLLLENNIQKVSVNLEEPVPGYVLSNYADVEAIGLDSNRVDVNWNVNGRADFNTTYSTSLHFTPIDHYSFTESSTILINGEEYAFEIEEDGSATVNYSYSTEDAFVSSIDHKKEIKGIENGSSLLSIIESLPVSTTAVVNGKLVLKDISWDTSNIEYDPSIKEEQTFTITGTISFDEYPSKWLKYNDGLSNTITCDVTVISDQDIPAPYVKENQPGAFNTNLDIHLASVDTADIYYLISDYKVTEQDLLEKGTIYNGESISLTSEMGENTSYSIYALASKDGKMSDVVRLDYLISNQDESTLYHYEVSNTWMIQVGVSLVLIILLAIVLIKF